MLCYGVVCYLWTKVYLGEVNIPDDSKMLPITLLTFPLIFPPGADDKCPKAQTRSECRYTYIK
jgi:hypothetical protein